MERIIKEMNDFTSSKTCRKYDAIADIKVDSEKGMAYDRAVAHKDIIKGVLSGEFDISEVKDLVSQGIQSGYILEEANKAAENKETQNLLRYLKNEKRTPVFPEKKAVDFTEELAINVKADCIFVGKNTVEAVIWRAGAPSINEKTGIVPTKQDNVKEWFKLWCLSKLAKVYAEERLLLDKGEPYTVKGSFYFMKKTTDNKLPRDNDFFSGSGGNVVSVEETYYMDMPDTKSEMDELFLKFIDDVYGGLECSEKDCESCLGKANCHYTKAPVKLQKKESKKRAKITPSDAQQKVLDSISGLYKVNATAGSGKTECMTERSKRLLASGVKPEEILHVSFTDAAVVEMKQRIAGKCRGENIKVEEKDIHCFTFNTFANNAIKRYYKELGYKNPPEILTPEREMNLIEILCGRNTISGIDMGSVQYNGASVIPTVIICAQKIFDCIKSNRLDINSPDIVDELRDFMREAGLYKYMSDGTISDICNIYGQYNDALKEDCLVTFADQEPLMFKVLEVHPEYFENLGYKHIIVDEFQDSNEIQVETIKRLVMCNCFESLMVVGDDSQAIYGFRNTTPEYIINFGNYMPKPVTDLYLTENRRSTPEIIAFANAVNDLNKNKVDKAMVATRESGAAPVVKGFFNKESEREYIVSEICDLIKNKGYSPDNIAFIGATKAELVAMGTLLTKAGIPWVMKNPMNLMENSRVLAAMSLADAFYQPDATVLYFNYLAAKYDGEILNIMTADEINAEIEQMKNHFMNMDLLPFETQRQIFHNYLEAIRKNVEDELYNYFLDLLYANPDIQSELEYTRIFKRYGSKMAKKMDQTYEGVVLVTAHSSKGLEWPVVFCSVTKFDSEALHGRRGEKRLEERRRLLFVAITRARDLLYLTGEYVAYGTKDDRTYNQFVRMLYDISKQDYNPIDPMESVREAERKERNKEKARERYAAKKASTSLYTDDGPGGMTKEQKAEYEKLIKGCKQTCITDFLK